MQVEVKTRGRVMKDGTAEVVCQFVLLPRGGGNRNAARRLGQQLREHDLMKPHIKRVVVGSSSVTVHFRASLGLMEAINQVAAETKAQRDIPGQLPLFG